MKIANRKIVEFIRDKWVIPMDNNSKFANENNIDEKTVRLIREDENYQISLITIQKICEAKELKLYEFFKKVGI
jgi:DNA-binding Xre family transcriptional regulator